MIDLTHLFTQPSVPDHIQTASLAINSINNAFLSMPPRSGKTSLAVSYAKSLTAAGKKVLYVTYSRILAETLCRGCGCDAVGLGAVPIEIGTGYDTIIADDVLRNALEANNEIVVTKAITWFDSILMSSACKPETRIILIGSRWHKNDFMGRCKKTGEWNFLLTPAIFRDKTGSECSYWPEQYPLEDLEKIRQSITADDFKWLYQQGAA